MNNFTIVMPPPNITGELHVGHALNMVVQDVLIRAAKLRGDSTLWVPGVDHAGIGFQMMLKRRLYAGEFEGYEAGTDIGDLSSEQFLALAEAERDRLSNKIYDQIASLYCRPDMGARRFTLDDQYRETVYLAFQQLQEAGLIYRAKRKVFVETDTKNVISDFEVISDTEDAGGTGLRSALTGSPVVLEESEQWFLRSSLMTKRALDAYRSGDMKFYPERWGNIYERALMDMQDWCISRQAQWGHPLPSYGSPDVLDTWFSSSLWPMAVLGEQDVFKRWSYAGSGRYPVDVLVTGCDLILFWVARMSIMSYFFRDMPPFREIVIHGLIRDENGLKMSKTLGNVVSPETLLNEYGVDGVRYGLLAGFTESQDISLQMDRFKRGKLVANKVYNAGKFVQKLDPKVPPSLKKFYIEGLNASNSFLNKLNARRFSEAVIEFFAFLWDQFCDNFIEEVKSAKKQGSLEYQDLSADLLATWNGPISDVLDILFPETQERLREGA